MQHPVSRQSEDIDGKQKSFNDQNQQLLEKLQRDFDLHTQSIRKLADDEGRFTFRPVPTGDYKLYAYAAGFLYGYVHGWSPAQAADLAARVAALTVGQVGAVVRQRDAMAAALQAARS